jgi:hypothetical protein
LPDIDIVFPSVLECGLRVFYSMQRMITNPFHVSLDDKVGWISPANTCAHDGDITWSTTRYGFRRFGDVDSRKAKILVIGDSFTEARKISDKDTYYDYLAHSMKNVELFAYGCGGYSSLQEYRIYREFSNIINPSLIIWQFCSNDLREIFFHLDCTCFWGQQFYVRPYYVDGNIAMLDLANCFKLKGIGRASSLYRLILSRLKRLTYNHLPSSSIDGHYDEAVNITIEIMKQAKNLNPAVPIVAFDVDGSRECYRYAPPNPSISGVISANKQAYTIFRVYPLQ